jgi:hypothetical protein
MLAVGPKAAVLALTGAALMFRQRLARLARP